MVILLKSLSNTGRKSNPPWDCHRSQVFLSEFLQAEPQPHFRGGAPTHSFRRANVSFIPLTLLKGNKSLKLTL